MDMSKAEAGPFLSGTMDKEAENTIAKGMAQAAAKRHMRGVTISGEGIFSNKAMIKRTAVAHTEIKEQVNAVFSVPKKQARRLAQ